MTSESVFKAYDVRGRTDNGELTPALMQMIGANFVDLLGAGVVAVGRDCRASSPGLAAALVDGISAAGADVVDLGEVTSACQSRVRSSHSARPRREPNAA